MEVKKTKHPSGLYTLFATEFWERFSYYGMRALLVLYLTAEFSRGGFQMERAEALAIYGIFTGLVYLTPIFGGILADKILGQRKAIFIGGIVMALGQFALMASVSYNEGGNLDMREFLMYCGLGLLILGNGFFKPNISTIVGGLYEQDDPRKDSAFTIFYMGINLGAFFSPIVAGSLGEQVGWQFGYMSAGIGMVLGTIWFYARRASLQNVGMPPDRDESATDLIIKDWIDIILYSIACVLAVVGFIFLLNTTPENIMDIIIIIAAIAATLYLLITIISGTKGKTEWSRVLVIIVLAVFNVVFWSGFEQAGGTFNLFAEQNTNRDFFGLFEIAASAFQAVNAIFIVIFAPIFSVLWLSLAKKNINPRTPVKFSIGLFLLGLGFLVIAAGKDKADTGMLVSPMWLVGTYLLHTLGELCLSPVGLSMITKLSPKKIVSAMMGLWMASIALGNYLAATMEAILLKYDFQLYPFIATEALVSAAILLALSPLLNKLMKGIH
ncbi:MAG TPA: MFS transporter [Cytophagales bacterium]|mgnify:CR=1 FL=1|jgi:POT family proton-dependent oligopeptide transporter|nr:MFS transporter [Cytophagales bacterium]